MNFFETIETIGNLCVIVITIITFYLTLLSRHIKVSSIKHNFDRFYGDEISIGIRNKTLHPICIESIYIFYQRDDVIIKRKLAQYDKPEVIPSWGIKILSSGRYTSINGDDMPPGSQLSVLIIGGTERIWSGKKYYKQSNFDFYRFLLSCRKAEKNKSYAAVSVNTKKFNDEVYGSSVRYIVQYFNYHDNPITIFLTSDGLMNRDVGGVNCIGKLDNARDVILKFEKDFEINQIRVFDVKNMF